MDFSVIKDAIKVFQNANNIEMAQKLFDVEQQTQDLIEENRDLRNKVAELQEALKVREDIERHDEPYITLKSDPDKHPYCATCYAKTGKLIQMIDYNDGPITCPSCNTGFSKEKSNNTKGNVVFV